MKTGLLIKQELQNRGLLLKFVAEKTGIPYGSLLHYLDGSREIPEAKIRLICLSFGMSPKIFGLDVLNSSQKKAV